MRNLILLSLTFFLLTIISFSCKKNDFEHQIKVDSIKSQRSMSTTMSSTTCVSDVDYGTGYDTLLKPTVLGYHLINHPYSLTNIRQAYTNLYGNANGVALTHNYVRFKPSSPQQLSILEDLDIDLFDYPLDYDVQQQGDYYDDGVTPAEEIPWLYAVVGLSFIPPEGIIYELVEQIHIPVLGAVENEAFRITGNPIDSSDCGTPEAAPDFIPECPVGQYWNGVECVPDPTPPPPPAPARQPSGTINVFDNNFNATRPVRNARIVAKRFLKVERTYTNNQGQFFITKEFNRVHILVKFENDQAKIRSLRRARLWQILFPVERNLGIFRGALNNIIHDIPYVENALTDGAREWAAATAHNNVQEYYDFAALQGIGTPPNKLRILLTNWRLQGVSGATPMFAKRFFQTLPYDFLVTFVISNFSGVAGGITALTMVLKSEIDLTVGYNLRGIDITARSDRLSEVLFHEQTHAAHYNKVGNTWWSNFVNAEIAEMIAGPSPYGNGTTENSPVIALGESWAYHMGHFMADLKYGVNSGPAIEQGILYLNNDPVNGLSSHLNLLEDFSPDRTNDPFRWIPQGLYYDLMDMRNEDFPIIDRVSGYTNQQFFNSLDADITSVPQYRARLLLENNNNQAPQVIDLFNQYHY